MAHKTIKQERPGVEQISPNTYRVGFLPTTLDALGNKVRKWVRATYTYPDTLSHEEQLAAFLYLSRVLTEKQVGECHVRV